MSEVLDESNFDGDFQGNGMGGCGKYSSRARKGETKKFVCNPEEPGFNAWKQVTSRSGQTTGTHRSGAYSRVASSDPQRADCNEAEDSCRAPGSMMHTLKQDVA